MRAGKVYLVGAGPGAPDLLTVRGLRALRRADVLVYDRLVDPRLLDEAPRRALRIFAGKMSGNHSLEQEEITALLIEHARRGRRVVRLKGGDPFVFGRGGEEALALARAAIAVEIVPGVSAAVAVPASAGIPVTHRGLSSSFAVVTGHQDACRAGPRVNWTRLATAVDTIVVLMAAGNLPRIIHQLLTHGRSPETPVALIRCGTTRDEETVTGTLGDILERPGAAGLRPPVTVVIGHVVALRDSLGRSTESPAGDEWPAGEDMLTSGPSVGPGQRHQAWRREAWGGESGSSARAPSDASWVGS